MNRIGIIASLSLKVTAFALVALTPMAISFKPYYSADNPGYPAVSNDPQYFLKAIFIAIGLITGVLAFVSMIVYIIFTRPREKSQLILHLYMTICAITLGWHVFPYCVNGILQASLGNAYFGDFDPTRLMPTIWIGEAWATIAFLLYPVLIVASSVLILMTARIVVRNNLTKGQLLQISVFLLIAVLSFVNSPFFVEWIAD